MVTHFDALIKLEPSTSTSGILCTGGKLCRSPLSSQADINCVIEQTRPSWDRLSNNIDPYQVACSSPVQEASMITAALLQRCNRYFNKGIAMGHKPRQQIDKYMYIPERSHSGQSAETDRSTCGQLQGRAAFLRGHEETLLASRMRAACAALLAASIATLVGSVLPWRCHNAQSPRRAAERALANESCCLTNAIAVA